MAAFRVRSAGPRLCVRIGIKLIRERRKYRAKMRKAKTASAAAFHARVAANKAAREERSKRWAQELERRRIRREQEALLEAQSPAGQRKARRISKLRAEITNEIYTSVFAAGKEAG